MFKKLVMALNAGNFKMPEKVGSSDQNSLTLEEIQLILQLIRSSTFKGEHVEIIYNTALKLQNQYKTLQQIKK